MSNRFNYRNSTKFIEDIIYSYDDLEGLLDYVPKKVQESKSLKEEIRILRLFRGNNKKFIIKVFQTNKDKLEDLVKYYMPSTIFDDSYLMNELIKLQPLRLFKIIITTSKSFLNYNTTCRKIFYIVNLILLIFFYLEFKKKYN